MRRFFFRLASLTRLRESELDEERRGYAREQSTHETVGRTAAEADARRQAVYQAEVAQLGSGARALQIRAARRDGERATETRAKAQEQLVQTELRVTAARGRLLEALRRVRGLDKLRKRARDAHQTESNRWEQRELDEIAVRLPSRPNGRTS